MNQIRDAAYQSLRRMGYSRAEACEKCGLKYQQGWTLDLAVARKGNRT